MVGQRRRSRVTGGVGPKVAPNKIKESPDRWRAMGHEIGQIPPPKYSTRTRGRQHDKKEERARSAGFHLAALAPLCEIHDTTATRQLQERARVQAEPSGPSLPSAGGLGAKPPGSPRWSIRPQVPTTQPRGATIDQNNATATASPPATQNLHLDTGEHAGVPAWMGGVSLKMTPIEH